MLEKIIKKLELPLSIRNSILLIFISTLIYSYHIFTTVRIGSDQLNQIASAINFLDGNGYTVKTITDNLEVAYEPLNSWPLGYRILITPILLITGKNIELSYLIGYSLSFLLFLIALSLLVSEIFTVKKNIILRLSILLSPFVFVPVKYMSDIDMITIGVTLFSVWSFLKFLKSQKLLFWLISIACISILPQLRYAYIPIAFSLLIFNSFSLVYLMKEKSVLLFFILIPFFSLFNIYQNEYFKSKSNSYVKTKDTSLTEDQIIAAQAKSWIKPYYSVFFNSFFPDYILASLLKKNELLYTKGIQYAFILFILFSMIFGLYLAYKTGLYLINFKYIFSIDNIGFLSLYFILFSNLFFFIILYRNDFYSMLDIQSGDVIYKTLSVVNRYMTPLHIPVFLITINWALSENKKIFKYLIMLSVGFGLLHFMYSRTLVYHPYSRAKNMDLVNNPPGSYNDIIKISEYLQTQTVSKSVYYFYKDEESKENYRQIKPMSYARAMGAIIFQDEEKLNGLADKSVYRSLLNTKEVQENWQLIFEGNFYNLYKLNNATQ